MAVKGSATVTLSQYRDTESVTRYYKLQSSSMAAPDKPANVKPNETPAGWSKAEPACDITKTLYTCDVTVFSDKTTHVSDVSKSTSYEAAKEAWNKANNAQGTADAAKQFTDNALNNYGYQYKAEIEVAGDPNTYYPVMIFSKSESNQDVMRETLVKRAYYEKAPAEWQGHTITHGIALTCKIKCNFGGWGGADYDWRIHELQEMYGHVFAGCEVCAQGLGFAIFLRGGGAQYTLYSDMPLSNPFRTNPTTNVAPSIWYERGMFGWHGGTAENPEHIFYTPEPRTYTDAVIQEIHDRTYIKVATDAYDKAGTAQNTADKAQSSADKAQNTATEAAKTADNYISADSTGIMVSENKGATKETPSNATKNNVLITEKDVQIRNGQKLLASYGGITIIGSEDENHIIISSDSIQAKSGTAETFKIIITRGSTLNVYRANFYGSEVTQQVQNSETVTLVCPLGEDAISVNRVKITNRNIDAEIDHDITIDNSKSWIRYELNANNITITIDGSHAEAKAIQWNEFMGIFAEYVPVKQYDSVVECDNLTARGKLKAGRSITTDYAEISGALTVGLGIDISDEEHPSISYRDNAGRRGDLIRIKDGRGTLTLTTGAVEFHPRWWRCGNIVQMEVGVKCTSSVASGSNIAVGTITGVPKPINNEGVRAVSYYGNNPNISYMSSTGTFYVRNAGADALGKNSNAIGIFTYITAGSFIGNSGTGDGAGALPGGGA